MKTERIPGNQLPVFVVVDHGVRTRSDKRHFATQHIQELRKFIDARPAEPTAQPRDSLVIASCLLHLGPPLHYRHGSELEDPEFLVVKAIAKLGKEHRSSRIELDQNRG